MFAAERPTHYILAHASIACFEIQGWKEKGPSQPDSQPFRKNSFFFFEQLTHLSLPDLRSGDLHKRLGDDTRSNQALAKAPKLRVLIKAED